MVEVRAGQSTRLETIVSDPLIKACRIKVFSKILILPDSRPGTLLRKGGIHTLNGG
jgi:hypothetical protein